MAKKKRRKLSRAQARAEAQRQKRQRQIMWAVAGVVAVAVVIVIVLIAIGGGESAELVEVEPLRDDIETGVTAEGYPYRGSIEAPVTIVEYSDYNCSVCRDFELSSAEQLADELIASGDVKYVVAPFALWQESLPIVEAAACAREQGAFWDFHHVVFANQGLFSTRRPPSRSLLRQFAEASGLDVDPFNSCLDSRRHQTQVSESTQNAKTNLAVSSTPTFFVNGVKTQLRRDEAYIDTIRKAVQIARAAGGSETE